MRIFITGVCGFVGFNLAKRLVEFSKYKVQGIDNLNNYYNRKLKDDRLKNLLLFKNFKFDKIDILHKKKLLKVLKKFKPQIIIHLAAQPGVRYSFIDPDSYIKNNILGFYNMIEISKKIDEIKMFFYASSSSVYSENKRIFSENEKLYKPNSLYGLTKKFNEDLAEYYSNYVKYKFIGLRFFSLYGPWGRTDMAYFKFTDFLYQNKKIKIFNYGKNTRDMTYIDDVTNAILMLINKKNKKKHDILNIGNQNPVTTKKLLNLISKYNNIKPRIKLEKKLKFENTATFSNTKKLKNLIGIVPKTNITKGIKLFSNWYKNYNGIKK